MTPKIINDNQLLPLGLPTTQIMSIIFLWIKSSASQVSQHQVRRSANLWRNESYGKLGFLQSNNCQWQDMHRSCCWILYRETNNDKFQGHALVLLLNFVSRTNNNKFQGHALVMLLNFVFWIEEQIITNSKDMRWSCCRMPELEAGGCTELCDLCGQVRLNSA